MQAPPRATNRQELPASVSIRLTQRGRVRLDKIVRILDTTQTQAVHVALGHLLATLEKGGTAELVVPSEQKEREQEDGRR